MNYNLTVIGVEHEGPVDGKCHGCKHHRHLYGVYCCAHPGEVEAGGWRRIGNDPKAATPDWCVVPKEKDG
jgi:hypothetical protein